MTYEALLVVHLALTYGNPISWESSWCCALWLSHPEPSVCAPLTNSTGVSCVRPCKSQQEVTAESNRNVLCRSLQWLSSESGNRGRAASAGTAEGSHLSAA